MGFGGFVGNEEEGCSGGGTGDNGADTFVDAGPATISEKPAGGLKARFEGVEGIEGKVNGGAGETAGLSAGRRSQLVEKEAWRRRRKEDGLGDCGHRGRRGGRAWGRGWRWRCPFLAAGGVESWSCWWGSSRKR